MENQISQILEKLQTFSPHAWEAAVSYVRTNAIVGMLACLVVISASIYLVKWSAPKVNNPHESPLYDIAFALCVVVVFISTIVFFDSLSQAINPEGCLINRIVVHERKN